jgi:cation diffusion facilitator family transporter
MNRRQALSDIERNRLIKTASLIAILGNAALAAAKIAAGIVARSLAVLGDGLDSSTDVIIALMGLVVAMIISKPADAEHPWGHTRAETMATTILAFLLFFAGAQLVLGSVEKLLKPESVAMPEFPALVVTVASIAGKLLLALVLRAYGKKSGSSMLAANAANMAGDVIISAGVLLGLLAAVLLKAPIADPIAAILVGGWVVKTAIGIFREANLELMDGTENRGPYKTVFDAALSVEGVTRPHRTRMRRIANKWDIDMDIEVDGSLTVRQAHKLAHEVEAAIKASLPDVFDIMVHVEPMSRDHSEEAFGLSESDMGESR